MTAEKQYVDDYANVYRGKPWSISKIISIMAIICATMVVRDIGMVFVYGSIYDKFALEGAKATVSFMSYVVMVLLYLIPFIYPAIVRITSGAYFDEPESSLIPSFNSKVLNIIMYAVIVVLGIIPVMLCMAGIFTTAYMFVAFNLALMLLSTVVLFYYFGTYILQRTKLGLASKYVMTSVFMAVTSVVAFVVTAVLVAVLSFTGTNVALLTHMTRFLESWDMINFVIKAICMFVTIGLATLVAGFIYNYSQNIIYSVLPTFALSYANIILFQRVKMATDYIKGAEISLADYVTKLAKAKDAKSKANYQAKIAEIEANIPTEEFSMILCYVIFAVIVVAIAAIGAYAVLRLISNVSEAAKEKKADN